MNLTTGLGAVLLFLASGVNDSAPITAMLALGFIGATCVIVGLYQDNT